LSKNEKQIIALLGCSHALTHGYLLLLAPLLSLLQKEFSMGYFGVGIIGNIMILAYGLGALPGGVLYDRFGPRKIFLTCFLGSAGISILICLSFNYTLFAVGITLLGALGSVYHPFANSLISQKVETYGRAMGIHGAAGNVGIALTPILAGAMASLWGWRETFAFFGLMGVLLSVWSFFIDISDTQKETRVSTAGTHRYGARGKLDTFFSPPLILLYLANMLNAFCFYGTVIFLPTYMAHQISSHNFSFENVAMGGILSGIVLSMGIIGQYTGGVLGGKPELPRNLMLMGALAFPFLFAMSFQRNFFLLLVSLIYYFLNFCMQPMCNVLVVRYTTSEARGTVFGIFFFISSGAGSFAASFAGYLAQRFGLSSVFQGMGVMAMLMFVMTFWLFRVSKNRITALSA
jgi:MFS family permease